MSLQREKTIYMLILRTIAHEEVNDHFLLEKNPLSHKNLHIPALEFEL